MILKISFKKCSLYNYYCEKYTSPLHVYFQHTYLFLFQIFDKTMSKLKQNADINCTKEAGCFTEVAVKSKRSHTNETKSSQIGSENISSTESFTELFLRREKPSKKEVDICKNILYNLAEEINQIPVEELKIDCIVGKRIGKNGIVEYKVQFKEFEEIKSDDWLVSDVVPKHLIAQYEAITNSNGFFQQYKNKKSTFFKSYSLIGEVLGITEEKGVLFCLVLYTDCNKAGFIPYETVKKHAVNQLLKYYEKTYKEVLKECKNK